MSSLIDQLQSGGAPSYQVWTGENAGRQPSDSQAAKGGKRKSPKRSRAAPLVWFCQALVCF